MLLTLALMNFSAADAWMETSLKPVLEAAAGESASSLDQGKIYAARGESESFQLWVQAGRKGLENLRVEGKLVLEGFSPPEIHQIAVVEVASGTPGHIADPLLTPRPISLERDQSVGFWITYHIPRDAAPGVYQTSLTLHAENSRSREVDVRVEIFDFDLPETPSLPVLVHLNRGALERVYGLPKGDLDPWKPVYDSLAGYRLSYSIWDGGGLVPITPDGRASTDKFKAHLEYALQAAPMAAIEITGQGRALASFPEPKPGEPQDPLQFYLFDMMAWLQERGLDESVIAEPALLPPRDQWQRARDDLFRCRLADKRVPRVLAAPPHAFFERYSESYALPYGEYDPLLIQRMKGGISLEQAPPIPARAHASASAGMTLADDAYDGSLHTAWRNTQEPRRGNPVWLELDFEEPVQLKAFSIIWEAGHEVRDIAVLTAFPGNPPGSTSVDWDHDIALGHFVQNRSSATLKFEKPASLLRLEFLSASPSGHIGIAEIVVGADEYGPMTEIPPLAPWLDLNHKVFPSAFLDAHPVEARAIPWVCWSASLEGVYAGNLNGWPRSWNNQLAVYRVDDPGAASNFLIYPGAEGPLPSIRLMRLRDGLEDYEYLKAMRTASQDSLPEDATMQGLLRPQPITPNPGQEDLAVLGERIETTRIRVGRWLTEVSEKP
jgi:hypothetical protein